MPQLAALTIVRANLAQFPPGIAADEARTAKLVPFGSTRCGRRSTLQKPANGWSGAVRNLRAQNSGE